MPGEIGVAQAMAGRGDLEILGVPSGLSDRFAVRADGRRAELDQAHAAIARHGKLGVIAVMRHVHLGGGAGLDHRRRPAACRKCGSGIVLGTSTSIPSTFTRIFSTGGCTGLGSAMTVVDILGARLNTNPFRAH